MKRMYIKAFSFLHKGTWRQENSMAALPTSAHATFQMTISVIESGKSTNW
jgi:hypothetical protein